jgi:hypothetical protein
VATPTGGAPWINQPRPTPDPTALAGSLPSCQAAQLSGKVFLAAPGAGTVEYQVQLVNRGPTTCALLGHPSSLAGLTATGQSVPISLGQGPTVPYVADEPALLAPGAAGEVAFLSTVACSVAPEDVPDFVALRIGVAGGTLDAADSTSFTAAAPNIYFPCGIWATSFARLPQGDGGMTLPGMQGLEVSLRLPDALGPHDSRLDYSVDITNPTSSAIALNPCPTYTERFSVGSIRDHKLAPPNVTTATYLLNCQAGPVVPPHGHEQFQMRLPLAKKPSAGLEQPTLSWRLNVLAGTGPETTSVCSVCQPRS